jgi:hypothetical protein
MDAAKESGAELDVANAAACIDGALARAAGHPFVISTAGVASKPWKAIVLGASCLVICHFHDQLN